MNIETATNNGEGDGPNGEKIFRISTNKAPTLKHSFTSHNWRNVKLRESNYPVLAQFRKKLEVREY